MQVGVQLEAIACDLRLGQPVGERPAGQDRVRGTVASVVQQPYQRQQAFVGVELVEQVSGTIHIVGRQLVEQFVLVQRAELIQQLGDALGNDLEGGDVHASEGNDRGVTRAQSSTSLYPLCRLERAIRRTAVSDGASNTSASAASPGVGRPSIGVEGAFESSRSQRWAALGVIAEFGKRPCTFDRHVGAQFASHLRIVHVKHYKVVQHNRIDSELAAIELDHRDRW